MLREQLDAYQDWTISASGGRWHNFLRDSRELKYARKNIYIYRFLVGYEVLIWAIAVIWLKKYTWSAIKIFWLKFVRRYHGVKNILGPTVRYLRRSDVRRPV